MLKFFYLIFIAFLIDLSGCSTNIAQQTFNHPPSTSLDNTIQLSSTYPQKIALLIPLQGTLANTGQAIRDGFLTAYYQAPANQRPAQIKIIDSSNNIQAAYNQAAQDNADFIIGPLEKNNLQLLLQTNTITIPTLSLNYLDPHQSAPTQLYQFGLSPLDEARQATALAWQNDHHAAIIITPATHWGQNLADAFRDQWQALGGTITDTLAYSSDPQKLNTQIRNLMHFHSTSDKKTLPQHRRDFDVIFLAASPTDARQIRPLLQFYYAGNIPIYATSYIYSGYTQPLVDNDLNGITFCDTPWALGDYSAAVQIRQKIAVFWPGNFQQNARFYALGVDAYRVLASLYRLHTSSEQTIKGATGLLYLNNQQRIVRQLDCAQFQHGIPVLLNEKN